MSDSLASSQVARRPAVLQQFTPLALFLAAFSSTWWLVLIVNVLWLSGPWPTAAFTARWMFIVFGALPVITSWAAARAFTSWSPRRWLDPRGCRHLSLTILGFFAGFASLASTASLVWFGDTEWAGGGFAVAFSSAAAVLAILILLPRPRRGLCPVCGFDLRVTLAIRPPSTIRCPECGCEALDRTTFVI